MTLEPGSTMAIAGYLAFSAALMLAVIASEGSVAYAPLIVGLLATSLPALVAWLYIDSGSWMGPEPICRIVRAAAISVAAALSLAGFLLTVWTFSRLAAFLILVEIPLWYLAISAVSYLREEPDSRT